MALQLYKIATVEVGSAGAANITFSNIPQGYTDLKVVSSTRGNFAGLYDELRLRFNGSSTGYSFRNIYGNGAAAVSGTFDAYSFGVGSTATANTFSNDEVYTPNYTSSNNKSFSSDFVGENNGTTAFSGLYAGLWSNSAAITSIVITLASGTTFQQYTTATLYGIL